MYPLISELYTIQSNTGRMVDRAKFDWTNCSPDETSPDEQRRRSVAELIVVSPQKK